MKLTSQMSHTRPFRWRRKHQQAAGSEPAEAAAAQQHLKLRSSAIGHHEHQSLSYEQATSMMSSMINVGVHQAREVAQPRSSSVNHSPRYSPSNTTTTPTTAPLPNRTRRQRRLISSSSSTMPHSLPTLMSLSIFACVILSLLNLSADRAQLRMVVAIGSVAASSTIGGGSATQTSSQSTATALQQQQQQQAQQSNSVISFPTVSAAQATSMSASSSSAVAPPIATAVTMTTTTTKAKYKTMYACEDRQLTMDCETGSKINLIRANFGRFSITQCNEQGQLDLATDCMSRFTFRIMQERCQDRQRCSVNATSAIFGDRCPTTRKYLEVHFQCLPDMETESIDLRKKNPVIDQTPLITGMVTSVGPSKPANNQQTGKSSNISPNYSSITEDYPRLNFSPMSSPVDSGSDNTQLAKPVINSQVMTPAMAINNFYITNKLPDSDSPSREPVIVSLRHLGTENVARPHCYQWDTISNKWTDRGARILETNQTHTICAFDQQTSYVLVMDYFGPIHPISPNKQVVITPSDSDQNGRPLPDPLESQPIPLDNYSQMSPNIPSNQFEEGPKMIRPQTYEQPQQAQKQQGSSAKMFFYLLGMIVVAIALMALTFVATSMKSTAGAALKSLGNFAPFTGPKYKHRRQNGVDAPSLHSNKDLLVINNSNGHSFIYAPASTTKISSSSSTHILSSAGQQTVLNGHQAGTLHRLQQQQIYSGNGATLSSLSGTGAQSNNYYYGLMGLNPLLQQQQQQQQHHFSQHHLNQTQQPQQAQLIQQQQQQQHLKASYNHQANKSSVSTESANSSASSSGVESGSTSMQQQQARTQQACLVSTTMNNNDFHLMGHHISNYGQHQPQQHNLFATLKGASVTHQPHQHQPTFTVNAHYSTSVGVGSGVQSINMASSNQTNGGVMLHNRQTSDQMRDHIYECVDDDKPYMARLLMPTQSSSQHQIFGSPTFMSARKQQQTTDCNARQK